MAERITSQSKDFAKWYTDVIREAELADYGPVKGTMIIRPYGYAIWENIQKKLDEMIKDAGVSNAYFPLFIPKSYLEREKEHVEGFSPEFAVVTYAGGKKLEEPVIVRPTSETVIHESFAKWIQSYRDLPLKINQWANVVRWELRTRLFLRTSEFLWQEGHCAFADNEAAESNMLEMLEIYRNFMEVHLGVAVITGTKSDSEKFAGADTSVTCEGLMKSGIALQMGTSHNLGTNFSKVFDVSYLDEKGKKQYAWLTSWGASTRLIGALIMAHGDERGLVLPPDMAPYQVVVIPIYKNDLEKKKVMKAVGALVKSKARIFVDDRENFSPGYKFNQWEVKGVPLRIELGPKDAALSRCVFVSRIDGKKRDVKLASAPKEIEKTLTDLQTSIYSNSLKYRRENTHQAKNFKEFESAIKNGGFVIASWCGDMKCEKDIKDKTAATVRAIPFEKLAKPSKICILCGLPAEGAAYFAKAY